MLIISLLVNNVIFDYVPQCLVQKSNLYCEQGYSVSSVLNNDTKSSTSKEIFSGFCGIDGRIFYLHVEAWHWHVFEIN